MNYKKLGILYITKLNLTYPNGAMILKPLLGCAAPFNPRSCRRGLCTANNEGYYYVYYVENWFVSLKVSCAKVV